MEDEVARAARAKKGGDPISEHTSECNAPPRQPLPLEVNFHASLTLCARECFNEVCAAAEWRPANDDQRATALSVIDGWLGRGFDFEQDILAGIRKARERRPDVTRSLKRFDSTIEGIHRDRTAGGCNPESTVRDLARAVGQRLSVGRR